MRGPWLLLLLSLACAITTGVRSQTPKPVGYWPLASDTDDYSDFDNDMDANELSFQNTDPPPDMQGYAVFKPNSKSWARKRDWNPDIAGAFTIEFWFKRTPRDDAGFGGWSVFLSYGMNFWVSSGTTNSPDDHCLINVAGTNSNNDFRGTRKKCAVNEWHHLAFSRGHTGGVYKLYIDGELEETLPASLEAGAGDGIHPVLAGNSKNLVLGQEQDNNGDGGFQTSQAFSGYMTELRIWSVERTQQEIQDNRNKRWGDLCIAVPGFYCVGGTLTACANIPGVGEYISDGSCSTEPCNDPPVGQYHSGAGDPGDPGSCPVSDCDRPSTAIFVTSGQTPGDSNSCEYVNSEDELLVGYWPLASDTDDYSDFDNDMDANELSFHNTDPPPGMQGYAVFKPNSKSWARKRDWNPDIAGAFTIEFWFKRTPRDDAGFGGWSVFLSYGMNFWVSSGTTNSPDDHCLINVAGTNSNDDFRGTGKKCAVNEWHHLAFTRGHTGGVYKLYIDGELEETLPASLEAGAGDGIHPVLAGNSKNLVLGQEQDNNGDGGFQTSQAFSGYMTELRIWSVERTQQEIQDNRNKRWGDLCIAVPGFYCVGETLTECANTPGVGEYISDGSCSTKPCNDPPVGQYHSRAGDPGDPDSCASPCAPLTVIGKYYSTSGVAGDASCTVANCTPPAVGRYFSRAGTPGDPDSCASDCDTPLELGQYLSSGGQPGESDSCGVANCTALNPGEYFDSVGSPGDPDSCVVRGLPHLSLVGYWPLASDTNDYSGKDAHMENNGLVFETAESPAALVNGYAVFDPDSTTWARVEDWSPALYPSGEFTIEFWFKRTEREDTGKSNWNVFLSYNSQNKFWVSSGITNSGGDQCQLNTGGTDSDDDIRGTEKKCQIDGEWHHMAFTRGPSGGEYKFYFDGVQQSTQPASMVATETDGLRVASEGSGAKYLVLGQEQDGDSESGFKTDQAFSGFMTELRVWNEERSAEQITDFMNRRLEFGCDEPATGQYLRYPTALGSPTFCELLDCTIPADKYATGPGVAGDADSCPLADCTSVCAAGLNETAPCNSESDRACETCGAGYICEAGVPFACDADEGFYCPAGYVPERRRTSYGLDGTLCPPGHYCAGGTADAVPCTAAVGYYCPAGFAPGATSLAQGLAGKRCPPGMHCAGTVHAPEMLPQLCDLAQSCGTLLEPAGQCGVRQSTFWKYEDPPTTHAVDEDESTCMKTADAANDDAAQWLRIDLGSERFLGTVRFSSAGAASDFSVKVSRADASWVKDSNGNVVLNPSTGGELPSGLEECAVKAVGEGVLEAACDSAAKGRYIFVSRAGPRQVLSVCDVEVFGHQCVAGPAALSCPIGYEPSACTDPDQYCPGCVPCREGSYSDKEGDYLCTPCPGVDRYGEPPYSPAGSTSVFQCEGDAYLDGTSTLEVEEVAFNTTLDAWEIEIAYEIAPRIQINGVSTIFLSNGGVASPANDETFKASNFPCRADASRTAGADVSASLSETVCCLQDMRQDYLMTKIFRDFTDDLDLVAANDNCDAEDGSDRLVNADVEVVGEGTVMVDTHGQSYATPIKVDPLPGGDAGDGTYTGVQRAKITIPDAELYKISRSLNPDGNLTDSRELFIGLLDLLPTGTRVVDSASQQISIVLTRTQYGTFAAYGEQNIDYDFISFLNARAHKVIDQSIDTRRSGLGDQYYAEVTFVYDDRLQPVNATGAVELDTVTVNGDLFCNGEVNNVFKSVVDQTCGPKDLPWGEVCPQLSIPDDHFGRLYIPLPSEPSSDVIRIAFDLWFKDMGGRNDRVTLAMDLVVTDFVTWCDADEGSVDLAQLVTPRIFVGTEADAPLRLTGWNSMVDGMPFATGAETLQDGLVTLILDLDDSKLADEDNVNSLDNLEVFFEDVLVIHVNPGSQPDVNEIKNAVTDPDENSKYMPTHNYDPDSRDAWLNIPPALKTDCPAEDATTSFFGCVHKHILRNKVITNETDAYFVGSAPPPAAGAQDFVETMLGDGTASVSARELGRDFEQYLMTTEGVTGDSRKSIGLWINPGHKWGGVTANSEYSLSNHLIIHVLFGVRSGIDGSERRMLLSTNGDGTTSLVRTLEYNVNAATLVESVMGDVIAIEVEAQLALSAEEACLSLASLRELCSERLRGAVEPHASQVERVECVSVQVHNANCDGARRAASAPVAVVDAVIALAESDAAFLDIDAVVASGSVLAMRQTAGKTFTSAETPIPDGEVEAGSDTGSGSGSNSNLVIGAAAGAAAGVLLLATVAWRARRCGAPAEALTEVVSVPVRADEPVSDKARIETLLFHGGR